MNFCLQLKFTFPKMKLLNLLIASIICFSFSPSLKKTESSSVIGFYIFVDDYTDRTKHKYIVENKDSVTAIFDQFFHSELNLGEVDWPITIYNGKHNFYVARVNVYRKANGKRTFRHLEYSKVYIKPSANKRSKLKPVTL